MYLITPNEAAKKYHIKIAMDGVKRDACAKSLGSEM